MNGNYYHHSLWRVFHKMSRKNSSTCEFERTAALLTAGSNAYGRGPHPVSLPETPGFLYFVAFKHSYDPPPAIICRHMHQTCWLIVALVVRLLPCSIRRASCWAVWWVKPLVRHSSARDPVMQCRCSCMAPGAAFGEACMHGHGFTTYLCRSAGGELSLMSLNMS